jgi:hypothetical protein
MAYGDAGGPVTGLVITCRTPGTGTVSLAPNDAVALAGSYTVTNDFTGGEPVLGASLAGADVNDAMVPVKVRGVCVFTYTGSAPPVDGVTGVVASATAGKVAAPATGNGSGVTLKVDETAHEVHVLF